MNVNTVKHASSMKHTILLSVLAAFLVVLPAAGASDTNK
jgi:hypothetical protein